MKGIDKSILKDIENITLEKYDEDTSIDYILANLIHEIEVRDEKIKELKNEPLEICGKEYEYGF